MSASSSSLPKWRQKLLEIPSDQQCASQKNLIRAMELLDFLGETFDPANKDERQGSRSSSADLDPFKIFLVCLEVHYLPVKDRSLFNLMNLQAAQSMSSYVTSQVGQLGEKYTSNEDPAHLDPLDVLKRSIYELIMSTVVKSMMQEQNATFWMGAVSFPKGAEVHLKWLAQRHPKIAEDFLKSYDSNLTIDNLLEMALFYRTLYTLKSIEHNSPPAAMDAAAADYSKYIQAVKAASASGKPSWYLNSTLYTLAIEARPFTGLEESAQHNADLKSIFISNLEAAKAASPPDPLYEAWATCDLALATATPAGFYFTELDALFQRSQQCLALCKPWVPNYFRKIMVEGLEIIEGLLKAAPRRYPNDYKTRKLGMEVIMALSEEERNEVMQEPKDPGHVRPCGACGKAGKDMSACAGCKNVYYCNRKCQKAHWKEHKAQCKPPPS